MNFIGEEEVENEFENILKINHMFLNQNNVHKN